MRSRPFRHRSTWLSLVLLSGWLILHSLIPSQGVAASSIQGGLAILSLPEAATSSGGEVAVPLTLLLQSGQVQSADLTISYDPAMATLLRVEKGTLVTDWNLVTNSATAGTVRIALAGANAIQSSGELGIVVFRAVGANGSGTPLTLTRGELNEGGVAATLRNGYLSISASGATRTPTASPTPTRTLTPTYTPTPTRTPTAAATATSTPFVVGVVRNRQAAPWVVPSICGTDGMNAPSPCRSSVTSGYFSSPVGRSRWGVWVQAAPNEVVVGVTPVPGGGTATINGSSAQYIWPRWNTGRYDVRFVVATITPTGRVSSGAVEGSGEVRFYLPVILTIR